jgi:hypothetical protein
LFDYKKLCRFSIERVIIIGKKKLRSTNLKTTSFLIQKKTLIIKKTKLIILLLHISLVSLKIIKNSILQKILQN